MHTTVFKHPILDHTIGSCLGDRTAHHGGDLTTVNVGHYNPADPKMVRSNQPAPSGENKKSFPRGVPMQHLAPRVGSPECSNGHLIALA